ncbi:Cupredoxin [Cyathus striatus]|nr:Cupredoxin [Cyathus striatus]
MYNFAILLAASLPVALSQVVYNVSVGAGGALRYDPQFVTANAGDIINFIFHPKNHTVTQSSFNTPCNKLDGGFDTDFNQFVADESGDLPVRNFTVPQSSGPLWFYCKQRVGNHCGTGMVFAINAPADPDPHSFTAFQNLAIAINGTNTTSSSTASSTASFTTDTYVTPPPPTWQTATATVTLGNSAWTTTYSSYAGSLPPTPVAQPVDHKIIVGPNGLLAYNPPNITASIGDTVTFEFHPKNHTVTQSSFSNPCQAIDGGFKSGFQPVAANATTFPTFQIKINDTAPIWGYCGQVGHCAAGMVFSINAVETGPNNFTAFQQLANRTGTNGTSASTSGSGSSPSSTSGNNNSGVAARVSYGLAGGLVGIIMAMML